MSKDRNLRKASFEAFYGKYEEFKNTWAAMYDGEVKGRIFEAKARKYNSAFEAAVNSNDVSPKVCDSLFESIHDNMDKMHRYVTLRKKLLGVDELHMYDVYVPMLADYDMKVTYDEAKELSLKALAPLGEDYLDVVKEAYENRWIDVVENEGKRGGDIHQAFTMCTHTCSLTTTILLMMYLHWFTRWATQCTHGIPTRHRQLLMPTTRFL